MLTSWVKKNNTVNEAALNGLLPFLPYGCKTPKGRFEVLRWLVPYRTACSPSALLQMADSVLDGILDKDKNTRNAAMDVFETMLHRCAVDRILDLAKQRRQADVLQIQSIINAFTSVPAAEKKSAVLVSVPEVAEKAKDDFQQRKEALSKRAGARVLAKPKLGPDGKPVPKYNVKSSIPKPMPRRTFEARRTGLLQPLKAGPVGEDASRLPVPLKNSAVASPVMRSPVLSNTMPSNAVMPNTMPSYSAVPNTTPSNAVMPNTMWSNHIPSTPLDTNAPAPSPELEPPFREADHMTQMTLNSNERDSLSSSSQDEADRVEFNSPVSAAQLFLPLALPPSASSSLFLDHWEEALKSLISAVAMHSPLLEQQAVAVLEQTQVVFGLFVPRFATAESLTENLTENLTETDRQAVCTRANEWLLLCCETLQTALREGLWPASELLFTGLMNVIAAPFSTHSAIPAVRAIGTCDG